MKKIALRIFKFIGYFFAGILLYVVIAFSCSFITISKEKNTQESITIFIRTNGVHTDIVVPAITTQKNWANSLKYEHTKNADSTYKYIAFGWGDKGFYLETPSWSELKVSTALKATIGLSGSAMHITYCDTLIENETCIPLKLDSNQYNRLINYLESSFQKDSLNNLIHLQTTANYNNTDAFYNATGRYNLFFTCNTWANNALKSCGQKCCLWTPVQQGIFWHHKP